VGFNPPNMGSPRISIAEAWRDGSDIPGALSFGASSFAVGQLPQVEENVRLGS